MKFTRVITTSFTKLTLFFHKVFVLINKLLPPEMLCAALLKLFAEALKVFMHAVFQLVVVRKTVPSEFVLQEARKMEVGGW